MLAYYFVFIVPAVAALINAQRTASSNPFVWGFVGLFYTLFVGLRMVGGDWWNYLIRFADMRYLTLDEALAIKDPGYQLISYYMAYWDWGFGAVTVICALISVTGLIVFLRRQVNPWLGLAVAVPYLVIVVYMGYMRQGVALGLVMLGMVFLERGKFVRSIAVVVLAATFHKTAIIMIAFGIFQKGRGKLFKIVAVVFTAVGIWSAFVGDAAEALYANYVEAGMESQGALIRVVLNLVPAFLLFVFRKRWKAYFNDYAFWVMIAWASVASVFLVGFASTAVDRMALYFLPIQIVVFSRLPFLARDVMSPMITTVFVLLLYFGVLTVWLNFSANSFYWIPYKSIIFEYMLGNA